MKQNTMIEVKENRERCVAKKQKTNLALLSCREKVQQICICQKSNLTPEYNRVKLRAPCERRRIYGSLLSQFPLEKNVLLQQTAMNT